MEEGKGNQKKRINQKYNLDVSELHAMMNVSRGNPPLKRIGERIMTRCVIYNEDCESHIEIRFVDAEHDVVDVAEVPVCCVDHINQAVIDAVKKMLEIPADSV